MRTCGLSVCIALTAVVCGVDIVQAAPTAAQRRELSAIRTGLGKAAALIRRRKYDEAVKLVDAAEKRLEAVIKEAKLKPRDRNVATIKRLIKLRRAALDRAQGKKPGAAKRGTGSLFAKVIAPIFKKNCSGCHSNNPKGGLRLDSAAGIKKVITPGNYKTSLLIQRLAARGNKRMPKNAAPLSNVQIRAIALWIQQGANFGTDATVTKKTTPAKVTISKPTGKETVSFVKDIAPFMVNLCVGCHNDRRKSGGLSLTSFASLMAGGKSGRVVLPGNLDGSRLWDLAGKQKPFKMPRGQARIMPTNWRNLRTWIREGAKFDGKDPKATLRSLVPTDEQLKAAKFAKMSTVEFAQYRRQQTETLWGRAFPKQKPKSVETSQFFVYGNVSTERLTEIGKWAEAHVARLKKTFRDKSDLLFKGKLAILVLKDRFGYEEFNIVIQKREIPPDMIGHSVVDKIYENAYIVLQDLGNDASETSPGMQVNLIDHLTGAYMKRGGGKLPD